MVNHLVTPVAPLQVNPLVNHHVFLLVNPVDNLVDNQVVHQQTNHLCCQRLSQLANRLVILLLSHRRNPQVSHPHSRL